MALARVLLALMALILPSLAAAQDATVLYDAPPWKVVSAMVGKAPTCAASNTTADSSATLVVMGRTIWAQIVLFSPAWEFPKSVGKLRLGEGGETVTDAHYEGNYIHVWTGDDPQIAFLLVLPRGTDVLTVTGIRDETLATFSLADYRAAFEAFEACVFGH